MIKARAWPVRAMYILIAAALAISLFITAAPAQKVSADPGLSEWTRVETPTMDGFVLAPDSVIYDYALADGGEVAYAVVEAYWEDPDDADSDWDDYDYRLLKSDDHAATWDDITDALEDVDDTHNITALVRVATDWEDPDFVAVALWEDGELRVYFSIDGGDEFEDIGEVEDGGVYLTTVSDLAVSYEAAGKREVAIGGSNGTEAQLFRSTVTGDSADAWEDATAYDGWDDNGVSFNSTLVTDIIFSPSWSTDKTILVTTTNSTTVWLQCGSWGTSEGWNEMSTLGIEAVPIIEDVTIPMTLADARIIAGITLPEDYNSKDSDDRVLWVWVNYYDPSAGGAPTCLIARVDDDSADPVGPMGQVEDGELWLTNVSYHGTIAEGEAIAGVLGDGTGGLEECCEGVQVYRNDGIHNMDICCERWHDACKPPTGRNATAVSYVGEDKAYAVSLQGGLDCDEGAWSVTFDDGDTWNQLSLIDTCIDYFSDVAVSPDCNKTFLVSVNDCYGEGECSGCDCCCDSVWLHADTLPEAEEYSGKWLRTWCGQLGDDQWGLLRLAPEETTGDNVYLVDWGTNDVYWNDMETLACWDPIGSTVLDHIVDLAAQDADTLYALDKNGDVAMFDDDEWQEEVESEVDCGHTIAVWGDHILVGSCDGYVSYSDDGGETFALLEDVGGNEEPTPIVGLVTVAFDSYFDTNNTIYAAVDGDTNPSTGGIYLWVLGESVEWTDIDACQELAYTGLVLDRPSPGNPMTSAETGGVLYASYYYWLDDSPDYAMTGVARCLTPIVEICCDVGEAEWDYLYVTEYDTSSDELFKGDWTSEDVVGFEAWPDALKICGCLTADSNSHLFAIDAWQWYDMEDGEWGAVWTFEDCYAKKGIELTSPADGTVIPADPCECDNIPFTLKWDRLCDACCYEFEFALDEDFTESVSVSHWYTAWYEEMIEWLFEYFDEMPDGDGEDICCMDCCYFGAYCPDAPTSPSMWVPSDETFTCEFTYYWRVRAVSAETGQCIRSWWSEPQSFTIAPSTAAAAIDLVSPEPGATGVAVKNVGFSWDILATADAFDWVLSINADLSSPLDSKTGLTSTACTYTGTLDYGTTYYWQVTAYNEGAAISTSVIGTFTTAATGAFCCPQCGLCFDTQAELQAHIADAHPAQPATPFWVWVIIVIGAVLVIVVIVLIFRTRRV